MRIRPLVPLMSALMAALIQAAAHATPTPTRPDASYAASYLAASHPVAPFAVGFVAEHLPDGTEIGIWYPAAGHPPARRLQLGLWSQDVALDAAPAPGRHGLVVVSHGTGGSFAEHLDTDQSLAAHGLVVAALSHPGDDWRDRSQSTDLGRRVTGLARLAHHMLDDARWGRLVDPARIGAFGYSAGGVTVLIAAGGRPDLARVAMHCRQIPQAFECGLLREHPQERSALPEVFGMPHLRAIVVAAPALGYSFGPAGLARVTMPVQLWKADADRILPAPFSSDAVRAALPEPPDFHDVAGAGHFDFLAPCDPALSATICASAPGFDRVRFHTAMNEAVVAFLLRTLGEAT